MYLDRNFLNLRLWRLWLRRLRLLLTVIPAVGDLVWVIYPGVRSSCRGAGVPAGLIWRGRCWRARSRSSIWCGACWFHSHGHHGHWHATFLAQLHDQESYNEEDSDLAEDQSFQCLHSNDGHEDWHQGFQFQLEQQQQREQQFLLQQSTSWNRFHIGKNDSSCN